MSPEPLPLLPLALLRAHHCHDMQDTRFRALARLAQALWRERHGLPCGHLLDKATGVCRPLGSRLTPAVGLAGANLVDPTLVPLVRRELVYREIGAVIDADRLWTNLLSSQPLTFNLFGPLKLDLSLATAVLRRLCPDLAGTVTAILFEHSPGRGDPVFTADGTAFDVLLQLTLPDGTRTFVAIEIKYSENGGGPLGRPSGGAALTLPRHTHLFIDPAAAATALRAGMPAQFARETLLAAAMLDQGLYAAGRLLVIAPALNREAWAAIARFRTTLAAPAATAPIPTFQAVTLEDFIAALGAAGATTLAAALTARYLAFEPVHAALAATFDAP